MGAFYLFIMEIIQQKREEIINKVQKILSENFTGIKAIEKSYRDRLNFACPYCGDSHEEHKKRGNLYWKTLTYHCYNCSKHANLIDFLKDHGKSITNKTDLIFFLDYIQKNQVVASSKDYMQLSVFENLREYSIPLTVIKEKLGLVEPKENLRIEKYLKGRFMHNRFEFFMYDPKNEQLYIFNLTSDLNNTMGWQIRNFKPGKEKYISYNIEKINQIILDRKIELPNEDLIQMNTLSIYFNIGLVDFMKPVTIFEGPIDALNCKNSIAISGVDKPTEMFDEISTVRYLFDNDIAGRRRMEYQLKRKKTVFMWNKLLRDFKIQPRLADMKSVKDFNDLLKYCWKTKNMAVQNFDKYFTNNPLDIRNV